MAARKKLGKRAQKAARIANMTKARAAKLTKRAANDVRLGLGKATINRAGGANAPKDAGTPVEGDYFRGRRQGHEVGFTDGIQEGRRAISAAFESLLNSALYRQRD